MGDLNGNFDNTGIGNGGGYLTDGRIFQIAAKPSGLGIFDFIGTNRKTAARGQPCSQSATANSENTSVNLTHVGTVRVFADPTSVSSALGWTDGNLGSVGCTLASGNGIVYDFCKSFNAFSVVNGQKVNNQSLVKPDAIMLYWSGAIGGVTQSFNVLGSRDGGTWETLATIVDGPRTWATGWVSYPLQSKRYYRFIKIVAVGTLQAFNGSFGWYELDLFGKIKFLKTSQL